MEEIYVRIEFDCGIDELYGSEVVSAQTEAEIDTKIEKTIKLRGWDRRCCSVTHIKNCDPCQTKE